MFTSPTLDKLFLWLNDYHLISPLITNKSVIIYGAGNFGKDVYQILKEQGYQVLAFLDNKAQSGDQWDGVPINLPNYNGFTQEQKKQVIVLVAIHNRNVDLPPIFAMLKEQGYLHLANPVEFYEVLADQLGERYWLASPSSYKKWQEEISKCCMLWEDEASCLTFLSIVTQRLKGDYSALPIPDLEHQYFTLNVPAWKKPLRFVNCGAYDGDTLRLIKNSDIKVEDLVAFEPDLGNFSKLSQYIVNEWNSPAILFPCGVHSATDQLRFCSDGSEGGKLSDSGDSVIQTIALDDALHGFHPNLIKMDIEGAEVDGLLGARKIIERDRPGLAICVYHKPQHLWQIPLMVNQWDLGYKFYLRSHAFNGFDVVMYALAT